MAYKATATRGADGNLGGKDFGIELKKESVTWSDILKKQGYSMGYIGKWHLDAPEAPFVPSYNNPMEGRYWNDWTPPEKRHGFDFGTVTGLMIYISILCIGPTTRRVISH